MDSDEPIDENIIRSINNAMGSTCQILEPVPGTSRMTSLEAATRESYEMMRKRKIEARKLKDRERKRRKRAEESVQATEHRRILDTEQHRLQYNQLSENELIQRRSISAERNRTRYSQLSEVDLEIRREVNQLNTRLRRASFTEEQRILESRTTMTRMEISRAQSRFLGRRSEMPSRDYLGKMVNECSICLTKFWICEKTSGTVREPRVKQCCDNGDIVLPSLRDMPDLMSELWNGNERVNKDFRQNIRAYNSLLSFTSCDANVDKTLLVAGTGIFSYRIHGEMYHKLGSLLPPHGKTPKFLQLYFYDTENELNNRFNMMTNRNLETIKQLQLLLRETNPWISLFKSALDENINRLVDLKLFIRAENRDPRRYNLPTNGDVAAILPGTYEGIERDIIIDCRSTGLKRINENHRSYDSFGYILLFPYGEFSMSYDMKRTSGRQITQMDYYSYRLHFRNGNSTLHRSGRLFLQFIVDVYCKIEQYRLTFIRNHQKEIRSEVYQGLVDAVNDNTSLSNIGRSIILPSSFHNSPRYMTQKYQDAMAIVRDFGKPDLFITFTCNPNWKEITDELLSHQTPNDRPDITVSF